MPRKHDPVQTALWRTQLAEDRRRGVEDQPAPKAVVRPGSKGRPEPGHKDRHGPGHKDRHGPGHKDIGSKGPRSGERMSERRSRGNDRMRDYRHMPQRPGPIWFQSLQPWLDYCAGIEEANRNLPA